MDTEISSATEVKKRLAIATGQLAKLTKICNSKNIRIGTKLQLLQSLIKSIALYGCETWTYSSNIEKRLNAFEMKCYRRLLNISWKDHRTNDSVMEEIERLGGKTERLLETARRRKMQWFGHVSRRPGTLANTIMHGNIDGRRGTGRPRRNWNEDIGRWMGKSIVDCMRSTENRDGWRSLVSAAKCPNGPMATGMT